VDDLLRNLGRQTRKPEEILVVDSSADDRTRVVVEEVWQDVAPRARHVSHEAGLTRQRNRAIQEVTGDILVFLDDDVELAPDFIEVLERHFAENPQIVGLSGFVTNEWGKPVERWWKLRKGLGLLPDAYREGRVLPYGICLPLSTMKPFEGLRTTEWLLGGATAWRVKVFREHRFSEFFSGYSLAEDKEFSVRVSRKHPLAVCGGARLRHLREHGGRPRRFRMGFYHVRNHLYLLHSALPESGYLRHCQQLWYWLFDAVLGLTVSPVLGYGRTSVPHSLGLLWGVLTHLTPRVPGGKPDSTTGEVGELTPQARRLESAGDGPSTPPQISTSRTDP
jgi:glycosyltransferase involved in cell wall biosynthesis